MPVSHAFPLSEIGADVRDDIERTARAMVARDLRYHNVKYRQLQMHIDLRRLPAGMALGPQFRDERIRRSVERAGSVLVFVDPEPQANFGHDCLYWLFDPGMEEESKVSLVQQIKARFPPYLQERPRSYVPFKALQKPLPSVMRGWSPPIAPRLRQLCGSTGTVLSPPSGGLSRLLGGTQGRRKHAILYAGNPEPAHVNDMEFCYRMLRDDFGFQVNDIHVLNFKNKMTTVDWNEGPPPGPWPGLSSGSGGTGYRLRSHPGIKAAARTKMKEALSKINQNLGQNDLVFIYTTAHGDSLNGESFLMTYQDSVRYWASEFATDLALLNENGKLPAQLVVMMQQCSSGGFMHPIVQSGCASDISFACAARANGTSYKRKGLVWNDFSYNWLSGLKGALPGGGALGVEVDGIMPGYPKDQVVGARELFHYASQSGRVYPLDSPQYRSGPPWAATFAMQANAWNAADQISLA